MIIKKCSSSKAAKKAAIEAYGGQCLITQTGSPDGAHIFAAGRFPALSKFPCNIVPLHRDYHNSSKKDCLDWIKYGDITRPPEERLAWLKKHVTHWEYQYKLTQQINQLLDLLAQKNIKVNFNYE